jgi:hypothetical protein
VLACGIVLLDLVFELAKGFQGETLLRGRLLDCQTVVALGRLVHLDVLVNLGGWHLFFVADVLVLRKYPSGDAIQGASSHGGVRNESEARQGDEQYKDARYLRKTSARALVAVHLNYILRPSS